MSFDIVAAAIVSYCIISLVPIFCEISFSLQLIYGFIFTALLYKVFRYIK